MAETGKNNYLEQEKLGRLMVKYAVPCVISMLVAALYNIVDQIFIANAAYLGSYGNAANTVVFPMTVVAISIAVMIGDGCCTFVSISLGKKKKRKRRFRRRQFRYGGYSCRTCTYVYLSYISRRNYKCFRSKGKRRNLQAFKGVFLLDYSGHTLLYAGAGS